MNITKKDENVSMFNAYAYSVGAKHLLTEAEQAQEDAKQKVSQAANSPEGQEAMMKIMQQIQQLLQTKYQKELAAAQQKDGGNVGAAVDALLKQIEAEIVAQAKNQVKTQKNESLNLEEGFLDRQVNKVKGMYQKGKDVMSGNPTNNKSWKDEAILKRFESLKQSLSKELAELKADLGTTSDTDKTVKDAVNNAIAQITTDHGISSEMTGLNKLRYNAGKLVQTAGIATLLGAPIAALAAPIAATVGLTGAGAAALTGGLTGGAVSMLKDVLNGQKPNVKKAAITAVTAAASAGLFKAIADGFSGHQAAPDAAPEVAPTPDAPVDQEVIAQNFATTQGSALDPNSSLDAIKKASLEVLTKKGVMGSSQGVPVPSPAVQNVIDAIAANPSSRGTAVEIINKLSELSPDAAQELLNNAVRKGGDKAVRRAIASLFDPK